LTMSLSITDAEKTSDFNLHKNKEESK